MKELVELVELVKLVNEKVKDPKKFIKNILIKNLKFSDPTVKRRNSIQAYCDSGGEDFDNLKT